MGGEVIYNATYDNNKEGWWNISSLRDTLSHLHRVIQLTFQWDCSCSLKEVVHYLVEHLAADLLCEFQKQFVFPYLVEGLCQVDKHCQGLQFLLESVFYLLCQVGNLVLCTVIISELWLHVVDRSTVLKMVLESLVDHSLHSLPQATKEADWPVTSFLSFL